MGESVHLYKLYLEVIPAEDPEAESRAIALLLEGGLSQEEAELAVLALPFLIAESQDPAALNGLRKKFEKANLEVGLEVEEADEEFEFEIDLSTGKQEYQRKGSQVYTIGDDGESIERLKEADGSVDKNEIDALLANLESSAQVAKPETPNYEELLKKELVADHAETVQPSLQEDRNLATEEDDATENSLSPSQESKSPKKTKKTPSKSAPWKKHLPTILASLGGSLLLLAVGIGAVLFFKPDQSKQTNFEQELLAIAKGIKKETKKKEKETSEVEIQPLDYNNGKYTGSVSNEHFSVDIIITIASGLIEHMEFTLATKEPPQLTDVEIVQGKKRNPWLHTIRLAHLDIKKNTADSFLISSVARAYVDWNEQRTRLSANAVISGSPRLEQGVIDARFLINKGYETVPDGSFLIEHTSKTDDSFKFFLQSDIKLQYKTTPKTTKE